MKPLRQDIANPAHHARGLVEALVEAEVHKPTLCIDLERLDSNATKVRASLPPGMAMRLVAKSLAAPALLARLMAAFDTDLLMTFNADMAAQLAAEFPQAHQLMGKPVTTGSVRRVVAATPQVTWLVDSLARVRQFAQLASPERPIALAVELDVGLHRGGLRPGAELASVLRSLAEAPHLRFAGLMGYEPHVAKLPRVGGWRSGVFDTSVKTYQEALTMVRDIVGDDVASTCIRNAGGSPTFRLYTDTTVANEVAIGSGFLKPTNFDTDLVSDLEPALFLAAPVLKRVAGTPLPGLDALPGLLHASSLGRKLPGRDRDTIFTHGGHWMAAPHYPQGLRSGTVFGPSSNQEAFSVPARAELAPDDLVLFRPSQSEAVLLGFGPIAVVSDGRVSQWWDPLPISV